MSLDELFQELLLDHFESPRCCGVLEGADCSVKMNNPLCGDKIEVYVKVNEEKLAKVSFVGKGCSISQATASMMTELVKGKSIEQIKSYRTLFQRMLDSEVEPQEIEELGDIQALQGIRKFPARYKCAMLAWEALEKCLEATVEQ